MSLVEEKYNESLDRMTGQERVQRTLSLFNSICEMLALQISKEFPNLSERETRRKVSERLYLSDDDAQQLLKKLHTN